MYIVSRSQLLSESQSQLLTSEDLALYPPGYVEFVRRWGEGTYRGWMNVQLPDTEVLKPFADYGLWEFDEDSPIQEQQISECISIGSTVDGDFLAVHPRAGLLWLPRHADQVKTITLEQELAVEKTWDGDTYSLVLDDIYRQVYELSPEKGAYYEPWTGTRSHVFLHLQTGEGQLTLPELAGECRAAYPPDFSIETPYVCLLFYRQLEGYIRFNYAYKKEVAVFYEPDMEQAFYVMQQWLVSKGCTIMA